MFSLQRNGPKHCKTSSTTIQSHHSSIPLTINSNSLLQFPENPGDSSTVTDSRDGHRIKQPSLNPHKRFLNRSIDTCPTHLTAKQKKNG